MPLQLGRLIGTRMRKMIASVLVNHPSTMLKTVLLHMKVLGKPENRQKQKMGGDAALQFLHQPSVKSDFDGIC